MNGEERAKKVYKAICDYMDGAKLEYDRKPEKNAVAVAITGDDFPVTLMFSVNAREERVDTYCQLPFAIRTEKAVDIAIACAAVNSRAAYGKFCLYADRNLCTYEDSQSFAGIESVGTEFGEVAVAAAYSIVDEYNDKIYAINRGLASLKDFTSSLK